MSRRPEGGFTLLEMLVASMLTILLALIVGRSWVHLSGGLGDCSARASAAQELRLALSSLSRDLGSTLTFTLFDDDRVLLCVDGGDQPDGLAQWGEPDVVVEYVLRDGQLVRRLVQDGREFIVADGVESLTLRSLANGKTLELTIRTRCGQIRREAELTWSQAE